LKLAPAGHFMNIRLTQKLAESIDGVDLRDRRVSDVFGVPEAVARLLLAEGWAVREPVGHDLRGLAPQNPKPVRLGKERRV
jgi:hypothetical protein